MNRLAPILLFLLTTTAAEAARVAGFESEAFGQTLPRQATADCLFSPYSFEMDCVVVAESLDTIPKANVSETMGAVFGFESVYQPIRAHYACRTNGYEFLEARAFCVPDLKRSRADHCQALQRDYQAEIMLIHPRKGAETWFRAMMDGTMEDFEIPHESVSQDRYSLFDLVSFQCEWERPFPLSNTERRDFSRADGTVRPMPFMRDVRRAFVWENEGYTLLKLPLKGGFDFMALLPRTSNDLSAVCADLSVLEVDNLLLASKSLTNPGTFFGPVEVSVPRLSLRGQTDLLPLTRFFRVPTTGLTKVTQDLPVCDCRQWARFVLLEGDQSAVSANDAGPAERKVILNRPFVFLVYHEETKSFPMAGVFAGIGS